MSVVVAGCKVNLGLRITGLRDNGYHELDSLFWPLPRPYDTLHINETGTNGIVVHCDTPGIDLGRNTLTRAYAALAEIVQDHLQGWPTRARVPASPPAGLVGAS